MLNSQNYVRDPEVIQIGETIASEVDLKDPKVKVYYHQIKGAQTHMPDGAGIRFVGGMFATSNREIQAFLDKIADKPGTQVFTRTEKAHEVNLDLAKLADEASKPTGDSLDAIGKGVATVEVVQAMQNRESPDMSPAAQALAVAELRNQGQTAEIVPNLFKR